MSDMETITNARIYATTTHAARNQCYDDKPYSYHLEQVELVARRYLHLIDPALHETVLAGCWVHDIIEDCGESYNDVKRATSEPVAEIAYALTTPKGRTRKERHCPAYYEGIRATPGAAFVKICDRIANVTHSRATNSSMLQVYRREAAAFYKELEVKESFNEMYCELLDLLVCE